MSLAGVEIQRRVPMAGWAKALDALPADEQPAAREYLRDMWRRGKVAQAYRNHDPDTSRQAAERVTASGSRADHVTRIVQAVHGYPGRTSAELAHLTELERHEAARRTSDAEHEGRIRKGEPKVCSISGKRAVTWWSSLTPSQVQCLTGEAA